MPDELSLIRFSTVNFFAVLLNSRPFNPISTLLIKLVDGLLACESDPDKKHKERIDWIYKHTHTEVDKDLAIVELAVFKNLDRSLNREVEIGNKTFLLTELYKHLDEVAKELTLIVIDIAKKYSIDIPMTAFGFGRGIETQEIKV